MFDDTALSGPSLYRGYSSPHIFGGLHVCLCKVCIGKRKREDVVSSRMFTKFDLTILFF